MSTQTAIAPQEPPFLDLPSRKPVYEHAWPWVLCLLGLDYFSTLAYQPSLTYEVARRLGPLATVVVVLVTLVGALPVYLYLAGRSPRGQGSLGMLERLVRGWRGKTLVLVLLGFAATDFTMLKSISLADAAVHLLNNQDVFRQTTLRRFTHWLNDQSPLLGGVPGDQLFTEQLVVTLLLGVVGFVFWFLVRKGFNRNVMFVAVPLVVAYLVLNGLLLGGGLWRMYHEPAVLGDWWARIEASDWGLDHTPAWAETDWHTVGFLSFLFLPSLALGLSGFELSMIVMPQVKGKAGEPADQPATRIANTRRVLVAAAVIMSAYLLSAVLVTTLLIPHAELGPGGGATNRAMAYLAHGGAVTYGEGPLLPYCGVEFGTLYDVVTVLVLCLAGTSVMVALAALLPQFLLRFGMEFRWADRWGLLLGAFALINIVVTLAFKASVEEQRAAYATGVLVLICSACGVSYVDAGQRAAALPGGFKRFLARLGAGYFGLVGVLFVLTTLGVVVQSLSGLNIALWFIVAILAMSVVSRACRADELRTVGFEFVDDQSRFLWDSLRLADFPVLVPHRPGKVPRAEKERQIRAEHQLDHEADIVFLEIELGDPSDFFQRLRIEVIRDGACVVIRVLNCVSVAHAIAAIALEMSRNSRPPGLHFGWSELDLLSASWNYLAFGEGNVPWKVRELIHRAEPDPARRPRVIVG